MGGEGSIAHMITTLRNNKLLLKGRRRFYTRRLDFKSVREFYRESTKPIPRQEVDEEVLKQIRSRIIKRQKRRVYISVIVSLIALILISLLVYSILFIPNTKIKQDHKEPAKNLQFNEYSEARLLQNKLEIGIQNLNAGDYFLAMGNFERLLKFYPDSFEIKLLLLEANLLMCKKKEKGCKKLNDLKVEMLKKYGDNSELQYLLKSHEVTLPKN